MSFMHNYCHILHFRSEQHQICSQFYLQQHSMVECDGYDDYDPYYRNKVGQGQWKFPADTVFAQGKV